MKEPFTFYRAVDAVKGSWDGYGIFPMGNSDFLAFVADAPSGASIHTPELIKNYWAEAARTIHVMDDSLMPLVLADAINQLQTALQQQAQEEGVVHQATLALVLKRGTNLFFVSIGDSAIRLLRENVLYTLSAAELWNGSLLARETDRFTQRQKVQDLQFIGSGGEFIQPAGIQEVMLQDGDVLLLNTDGVDDMVAPDRLMSLIKNAPDDMRAQLSNVFAHDRIKDDATLLVLPIHTPRAFNAQEEVAKIAVSLDALRAQQTEMIQRLNALQDTSSQVDRIERNMKQLSQHVESLSKRTPSRLPSAALRKENRAFSAWFLVPILLLLVGAAAGFLYLRPEITKRPEPSPQPSTPRISQPARPVNPPEIEQARNCEYLVQKGDTLEKIASTNGTTVDLLKQWNPALAKSPVLKIGQKLQVCGGGNEIR